MILTVNIGNTHITVGGYEQDTLIFCGRLHSDPAATVEEYAIRLVNLLQLYGASPAQIEGGILGSVVPMLSGRVLAALQLLCKARILTVGPGLKSGIKLRLDNPAQLGAELLCGAVAALADYAQVVAVGVNCTAPGFIPELIAAASIEAGEHLIAPARALLEATGLECESAVGVGDPAHTLVDIIETAGCDLVLIGARGQGAISSALLGSVSQELAHASPVPVTIVKHPEVLEVQDDLEGAADAAV